MAESQQNNNPVNLAALQQQMKQNPKAGAAKQTVYLDPVIDYANITCSNVMNPAQTNWKPFFHMNASKSAALVSDDEPQFCVRIPFKEQVELTTVVLSAQKKPVVENMDVYPPKEMWFIANNSGDLEFDDLNENCNLDEDNNQKNKYGFEVSRTGDFDDHDEVTLKLPPSRFKGVTNIVVFFKKNAKGHAENEETLTFLNNMRFVGKPSGNKDISAWEPCKS